MSTINLSWSNYTTKDIILYLEKIKIKENIQYIHLEGNFLLIKDFHFLFHKTLPSFIFIHHLNLSRTNISSQHISIFSKNISFLPNLRSINLSYNFLNSKSIRLLKPVLPQLEELSLSSNFISNYGIYHLISQFHKMTRLKKLYLAHCFLKSKDILSLSSSIGSLTNLEYFSIQGNKCNTFSFCYLLESIPSHNLIYLNLGKICSSIRYDLGSFSTFNHVISSISSSLGNFYKLKYLIWNMYFNDTILLALENCIHLKKLSLLTNVFLYDIEISSFPQLPELETLKISTISNSSLLFIMDQLPFTIKNLNIQYIFFDDIHFNLFSNKFFFYTKLSHLEINNCSLHFNHILILSKSLKYCSNIKYLAFDSNFIDDQSLDLLISFISFFKNLTYLSLVGNLISSIGFQKLLSFLCKKNNKISIFIDDNIIDKNFTFFQQELKFINSFYESLFHEWKWNSNLSMLTFNLDLLHTFSHSIDIFLTYPSQLSEYNFKLQRLKQKLSDKKGSLKFNKYFHKYCLDTNHPYGDENIQRYIQDFL